MGCPHHRKLILVKHAEPVVESRVPPNRWELSERGRGQSVALAERLRRYRPAAVVASEEPKVMQTACLAAERLGVAAVTFPGLHEHDRTGTPFGTQAVFELAAKGFFEKPGELVWGKETADEAQERFAGAIDGVFARHPAGDVVVVAHGTVITLFLSQFVDLDAFGFWRRLGLPSFCVLELPSYELREVGSGRDPGRLEFRHTLSTKARRRSRFQESVGYRGAATARTSPAPWCLGGSAYPPPAMKPTLARL